MAEWDFSDAPPNLKVLYYTPFAVAPISCISSGYVAYLILRPEGRRYLRRRPRDHFLLGMSVCDICSSYALAMSTIPGPSVFMESSVDIVFPTYGTVQTCAAQGILAHMGLAVPLYYAAMCIYYVLSIRYRYADVLIMRRVVPLAHSFILLWTIGTALVAFSLKLFNFAGFLGCWIATGDEICRLDSTHCDRGRGADNFILYVAIIPFALCFVIVVSSMFIIYLTVRELESKSRRWDFGSPSREGVSTSRSNPQGVSATRGVEEEGTVSRQPRSLSRRTMKTSLLYSGVFILVYLPLFLTQFLDNSVVSERAANVIKCLAVFFYPLQGFWNMIIFTSHIWTKSSFFKKFCSQRDERSTPEPTALVRSPGRTIPSKFRETAIGTRNGEDTTASRDVDESDITHDSAYSQGLSAYLHAARRVPPQIDESAESIDSNDDRDHLPSRRQLSGRSLRVDFKGDIQVHQSIGSQCKSDTPV